MTARTSRSEAPTKPEGGTTAFGKYQLFASLGRGGMADVFLSVARGQMGFNKLAVIKRLRPALAEEAAFRNMFLDEARLAARLGHPNIVHTYEVGEQAGVYFIAMEYLDGQSLNKVLKESVRRKERIDPTIAVRIVADALAGLGYAHDLRDYDGRPLSVIHRDVSPHNVFVTYDGHTKLVDFGIAKAALSSTETEVGVLKGKVAYMSPEQAMGQPLDARADLFAMGIVLWELLAQQRLMTGESAANTLHKLMSEPIPRLGEVVPYIDPSLDQIVARSLEKDPAHRFQSALEMRGALESWLSVQHPPARQEDVGRLIAGMFGPLRAEVQQQIQKHMAALNTANNTQELQALTAESLRRMEAGSAAMSGPLLQLGGSGSGSGVIASYGGHHEASGSSAPYAMMQPPPAAPSSMYAMPIPSGMVGAMPPPQQPRSSNALLIVITIGFFVLAALLIVVYGFRKPEAPPAPIVQTPPTVTAPTAAETTPPPPPTAAPLPPVTATAAPTATATATATTVRPVRTSNPVPHSPPPAAVEDPGFVTMSAYPWAKVSEGAKVVCPVTPCNKVQMTPGAHTLTFENGVDPGQKQTLTVQVKSGETVGKTVGFK